MTDLTLSQFASKDDMLAAQAARIAELESQLEAIGAGGVEPLRKHVAAPQAVQAAVPDGWVPVPTRPTPQMCHAGRYGGDTDAPAYGEKPVEGETAWPIVADHTAEKIYLAMLAAAPQPPEAPAHPAEGVPADFESWWEKAGDGRSKMLAKRAWHAALAATQPAAQGIDGREFPPLTPELASILGRMCFQCISFAQALRAAGHTIKTRAEDEQAAVLHWMLGHYFRHGDDWRTAAAEDMKRMEAEALAAQAKQGGA